MKTAFILFFVLILLSLHAKAVAPYGIKGQNQSTSYPNVHQFPNNQVTKLAGINALIETGNNNLLANPSFEHSTYDTSWDFTGNASTKSLETTFIKAGVKALKLQASGSQIVAVQQSSTLYATSFGLGIPITLSAWIMNSSPNLYLCAVKAGVLIASSDGVKITNCLLINTSATYGEYRLQAISSATSNGVAVVSLDPTTAIAATTNGATYLDDFKIVAGTDLQVLNNVGPWTTFTPTGTWTGGNVTYTGRYRQVGQNMEFEVGVNLIGAPTGTNLIIDIPNSWTIDATKQTQTVGKNVITTKCWFVDNGVLAYDCSIYDSASTSVSVMIKNASSTYVSESANVTNSIPTAWGSGDYGVIGFTVPLTHLSGSSSVYTAQNADTDWQTCTGSGSWSTNTTYTCRKKRNGDVLELDYLVSVTGAPTSANLTVTLPDGLVIDTAKLAGGSSAAYILEGSGVANDSGTKYVLTPKYVSTTTVGALMAYDQTASGTNFIQTINDVTQAAPFTFATGDVVQIRVNVPIVGWQNSNLIIGTFNEVVTSPGISKPKVCMYALGQSTATLATPVVFSSGTAGEVFDSCGTGSAPTFVTTGRYANLTFANGTFANSTPLICSCSAYDTGAGPTAICSTFFDTSDQTWSSTSSGGAVLNLYSNTAGGVVANTYMIVRCEGQAP